METISVLIVLEPSAEQSEAQEKLKLAGLERMTSIPGLRILRGFVDPLRVHVLRAVPGVSSVEAERSVQLPPRDSPVQ